jgi:hypothetical protein
MTPTEWAREPGVTVCGVTIRRRVLAGEDPKDAIYGGSKTLKRR